MSEKLVHDATKTITPIFYQCYIALEKCFDLMENESVYIETYGDVTVVSENESSQTEVKNYASKYRRKQCKSCKRRKD